MAIFAGITVGGSHRFAMFRIVSQETLVLLSQPEGLF